MSKEVSVGSSIREQAFLGEHVEPGWVKRVESNANLLSKNVLGATDPSTQLEEAESMMISITGGRFKSAVELVTAVEADKTGNTMLRLTQEMASQSLYLAMRDGGVGRYVNALNTGNTTEIAKVLPANLRALAREVRNHHFPNREISTVFDQIDAATSTWDIVGPSPQEEAQILAAGIASLRGFGVSIPKGHPDRPQLELALKNFKARIDRLSGESNADEMKLKYFKTMFVFPTPDTSPVGSTLAPEWEKALEIDVALKFKELNNSAYVLTTCPGVDEWTQVLFRCSDKVMNVFFNEIPGMRWLAKDMLQKYFEPTEGSDEKHFNLRFKGHWEGTGKNKVWKIDPQIKEDFADLDVMFDHYVDELIDRGYISGKTRAEKEANAAMVLGVWGSLLRVSLLPIDANPSGSRDINTFGNQVWKANYPEAKGLQKFAFERDPDTAQSPFAGNFGQWLRARRESANDPKSPTYKEDREFMRKWIETEEIHPLPERLMINFFSYTDVEVTSGPFSGKKVCMLKALYEGWEMSFPDKGGDSWIGYHDLVRSAAGIVGLMGADSKEAPIMFGKTNYNDWALGLEKKFVYLRNIPELEEVFRNRRKPGEDHSPWAESVMWMLGACAGGFANNPDLVIIQGASGYQEFQIITNLFEAPSMKFMLDKTDRDWIATRLNLATKDDEMFPMKRTQNKRKRILQIPGALSFLH